VFGVLVKGELIKHMANITKADLEDRFKDNIVVCIDISGWPQIKRERDAVWSDAPFYTETDEKGDTYYVFTQFKKPEYAEGY
jgi:hypothetical protein